MDTDWTIDYLLSVFITLFTYFRMFMTWFLSPYTIYIVSVDISVGGDFIRS